MFIEMFCLEGTVCANSTVLSRLCAGWGQSQVYNASAWLSYSKSHSHKTTHSSRMPTQVGTICATQIFCFFSCFQYCLHHCEIPSFTHWLHQVYAALLVNYLSLLWQGNILWTPWARFFSPMVAISTGHVWFCFFHCEWWCRTRSDMPVLLQCITDLVTCIILMHNIM